MNARQQELHGRIVAGLNEVENRLDERRNYIERETQNIKTEYGKTELRYIIAFAGVFLLGAAALYVLTFELRLISAAPAIVAFFGYFILLDFIRRRASESTAYRNQLIAVLRDTSTVRICEEDIERLLIDLTPLIKELYALEFKVKDLVDAHLIDPSLNNAASFTAKQAGSKEQVYFSAEGRLFKQSSNPWQSNRRVPVSSTGLPG